MGEIGDQPDLLLRLAQQLLQFVDRLQDLLVRRIVPDAADEQAGGCQQLRGGIVQLARQTFPLQRLRFGQLGSEFAFQPAKCEDFGQVEAGDEDERAVVADNMVEADPEVVMAPALAAIIDQLPEFSPARGEVVERRDCLDGGW